MSRLFRAPNQRLRQRKFEQQGFDHQESTMPSVPDPDTLLSLEELRERRITDPHLPRSYRNMFLNLLY
ncbi:predicted protein [Arabidopsis lyrata subsp. lyrata]|uniref:Predicted protein n=1 Tax=Arabidopsis lyrata subsp. lyrata TaxID=81972 RepID=D7KP45_ARALL|nr:predicted protein [Arabidopsis lyrata subsp. lyrata]